MLPIIYAFICQSKILAVLGKILGSCFVSLLGLKKYPLFEERVCGCLALARVKEGHLTFTLHVTTHYMLHESIH